MGQGAVALLIRSESEREVYTDNMSYALIGIIIAAIALTLAASERTPLLRRSLRTALSRPAALLKARHLVDV